MRKTVVVNKLNSYERVVECPADKSISVRAVLMCGNKNGITAVANISQSKDACSAIQCVEKLGCVVTGEMSMTADRLSMAKRSGFPKMAFFVGTSEPRSVHLNCGNSATTARLLMGILAGKQGEFVIDGDASLRSRPMQRVIEPLRAMGADITDTNGHLPVTVREAKLHGIDYEMPISSAQVKSAILLAGLNADGQTRVTEKVKTRDHTEKLIEYLGGDITVDGNTVTVKRSEFCAQKILTIPGDISSAAYPICAALALKGACTVKNVGINPTRTRYIEILRECGADIHYLAEETKEHTTEPSCYIVVRKSEKELSPFTISGDDVAKTIDEIPVLCALACFINGTSVIDGAGELRVKESDRIKTTVAALKTLGADIEETENGIIVCGGKPLSFGTVDPMGDHRIAMAAAVAGACGNGVKIIGADCAEVSYPDFYKEVVL